MAKKKKHPDTDQVKVPDGSLPRKPDAHKGVQFPLRFPDVRLLEALSRYAHQVRRSRNMGIIILLEEGLQRAGYWPPPDE
jgi:hypothetical protein